MEKLLQSNYIISGEEVLNEDKSVLFLKIKLNSIILLDYIKCQQVDCHVNVHMIISFQKLQFIELYNKT